MKKKGIWRLAAIAFLSCALFVMPAAGTAAVGAVETGKIDVAAEIARAKQEWLEKEAALTHEAIPVDAETFVKDNITYTVIRDCAGFQAIEENLAGNYIVANDLDMTEFTTPIGWTPRKELNGLKNQVPDLFSGIFDGNHYKIKNLINLQKVHPPYDGSYKTRYYGVALFNNSEGVIRNLIIDETCKIDGSEIDRIDHASSMIGSEVAFVVAHNYGLIENCISHGSIVAEGHILDIGGICAELGGIYSSEENNFEVSISNCTNFGIITTSDSKVGGIVGVSSAYALDQVTLSNLNNFGNLTGLMAGGIIADFSIDSENSFFANAGITNSNNYASVTSIGEPEGIGQAGGIFAGNSGKANNCRNYGLIKGELAIDVGGIGGQGSATNCINYGAIFGKNEVGGIIGRGWEYKNQNISKNLQYGDVTGEDYIGGIVGASISLDVTKNENHGNIIGTGRYVEGIVGGHKFINEAPYKYNVKSSKQSDNINTGIVKSEGRSAYLKQVRNRRNGIIIGCTLGSAVVIGGIVTMLIIKARKKKVS